MAVAVAATQAEVLVEKKIQQVIAAVEVEVLIMRGLLKTIQEESTLAMDMSPLQRSSIREKVS